ncbi:MAG: hypothetical protein ABI137_09880 [Antricoccus sp.]
MPSSLDPLPERWPSAWPSLRSAVFVGLTLPLALLVTLIVILSMTKVLAMAWWLLLVPAALMIRPLSLPRRVRSVIQLDADFGRLRVSERKAGLLASSPKRRRGVRPRVELRTDLHGQKYIQYYAR